MLHIWHLVKDGLHTPWLRVAQQHLPEAVATYKMYEVLDARHIEFVKHIIEQQDRLDATLAVDIFKLRQLQRKEKSLLLPLRAETLDGHIVYRQLKVVAMRPYRSVERIAVALACMAAKRLRTCCSDSSAAFCSSASHPSSILLS